jgi:hypothetical protein
VVNGTQYLRMALVLVGTQWKVEGVLPLVPPAS